MIEISNFAFGLLLKMEIMGILVVFFINIIFIFLNEEFDYKIYPFMIIFLLITWVFSLIFNFIFLNL